ncbi:hypothetical protein [Winogradskyella sp. SYSU M77433]|uniref:hypothetical protein n=1 Tax=Winogradskyella sp. SYSU M77433 TaxID=3042722 RepID=UPI0024807281|nr:hypothetical protein [Winogradskyella sp. SYSU M77433]MDH7913813.1 hypothetical protein [Winogradskyella sp. SYSU M77433]
MKPPHIKEKRQKEVRHLINRTWEIYLLIRELGYIELEKPIRHGWYKEIVITRKVERYKNKAAILEIYDKIEKYYWGRTKKEAEKKWHNQTSRHFIYKGFPTLSKKQFNKLSYKAQSLCTSYQYRNECKKLRVRFYIRIPKGAYKIRYARAYITHRKRIDPNLISELNYIEKQLLRPGYYNINEAFYPYKDNWNLRDDKQEKLKTKQLLNQLKNYDLEDLIKDNISWERN